jgi:regulatory protein YycH of two-component signal transduction system YycFG
MRKQKLNKTRNYPMAWVTVKPEGLIIEWGDYQYTVSTKEEYNELFVDSDELKDVEEFICSSSIDFPKEETDDPEILAVVKHFRGK